MMLPAGLAIVLLAAGRSSRFGGNKLEAALNGRPVIHHAAGVLSMLGCPLSFVVSSGITPDLRAFGFRPVDLGAAAGPMSLSIARGVEAAAHAGAQAVLIALADMPFIPVSHFGALIALFLQRHDRVATLVGGVKQSPAIFGAPYFSQLRALQGDAGARSLLAGCACVDLPANMASDIDTIDDLAAAQDSAGLMRGDRH